MKYIFLLFLIPFTICEWAWGWCRDKKDVHENKNITLSRFNGTWYEIMRTRDDSKMGDCVSYDFTPTNEGNMLVNKKGNNGTSYNTTWRKDEVPTHFKVEIEPFLSRIYDKEYNIVNTDYEKFAILYSCYNAGLAKDQYVWILSKTPEMDATLLNNMTKYVIDKFQIESDDMININQNNTLCKR